jgi:hypothetical protein
VFHIYLLIFFKDTIIKAYWIEKKAHYMERKKFLFDEEKLVIVCFGPGHAWRESGSYADQLMLCLKRSSNNQSNSTIQHHWFNVQFSLLMVAFN